jgi:hypothetical protein
MRVRISFDALRLCALVAAGVTSGYLWRAAFESTSPQEVRTSATPRVIEPAPESPVVRIPPGHLTQPSGPAVTERVVNRPAPRPREAATGLISAPVVSVPRPRPAPTAPKPGPSSNPPSPPAPATPTTPTPPSPPPTTPTTPVVSPPTQAAASPPTTPATSATPPTSNGGNGNDDKGDERPGWGNGDKNHDHSGPGGKKP